MIDGLSTASFGDLLRRHRRAARMTQEMLAEKSGLSYRAISDLERGARSRPRRETALQLAEALDLSAQERAAFIAASSRQRLRNVGQELPVSQTDPGATTKPRKLPSAVVWHASPTRPALLPLPTGNYVGARPESPLIGRESERGHLADALQRAAGGAGTVVMLAGEAGIGKTRLAQEAHLLARSGGWLVASGRCYASGQAVAYFPFLEALSHLYHAAPHALCEGLLTRWSELQLLLPEEFSAATAVGQTRPEDQLRLFWQFTAFVQALAEQHPVAILLDDLHWSDSASLDLLAHVARHTAISRLLLLGTYRPEEAHTNARVEAVLHDLHRDGLLRKIALGPLSSAHSRALIFQTLGGRALPDPLAEGVYARAHGNAFFTREIAREMLVAGNAGEEEIGESRSDPAHVTLPDSIRALARHRLAQLPPDAREVMLEASVLGQRFGFDDLAGMGNRDADAVERALALGVVRALIREMGLEGYAFVHALLQEALYAELSPRRRKRLHAAAAASLERLPERQRQRRAPELVRHYIAAGERERALPYALLAGDAALAVYANAEAEGHYRLAAELAEAVGDRDRETSAREALGKIYGLLGRYADALGALECSVQLYEDLGNFEALARASAQLGWTLTLSGQPDVGVRRLHSLLESLDRSRAAGDQVSPVARSLIHRVLAQMHVARGAYREQLVEAHLALEFADRTADDRMRGEAELQQSIAQCLLGSLGDAEQSAIRAIQRLERADDMANLWIAHNCQGVVYRLRGEWVRSTDCFERGLVIAERLGDPAGVGFLLVQRGLNAFCQGEWSRACDDLAHACARVREVGSAWLSVYPSQVHAFVHLHLSAQERSQALATLQEGVATTQRMGDMQLLRHISRWLGEYEVVQGCADDAVARLSPFVDVSATHSNTGINADINVEVREFLPFLAWAYLALDREEQAHAVVRQAVELAEAAGMVPALIDGLRVGALVALRRADLVEANALLARGLKLARALHYPYAEAKLLAVYGDLCVACSDYEQAREKYRAALAICEQLGEGLYRPHIERALAAVPASRVVEGSS